MKPKEKAKTLVNRFYYSLPNNGSFTGINSVESRYQEAKQCALIAIDEILQTVDDGNWNFYKQVQEEIEQLR
jgi:hypothetical protein